MMDFIRVTGWAGAAVAAVWALNVWLEPEPADIISRAHRVIDGDTLVLENGAQIRVWALHAPELGEPGGREAKE